MATSYDPAWLRIMEHQIRRELAQGREVLVVDATALLAAPFESYDRATLSLFRVPYPGHDLRDRIVEMGARYIPVLATDDPATPLSQQLEEQLEIAIQSGLITFFRTDRPNPRKHTVRTITVGLRNEGRRIYRAVTRLLAENPDVEVLYVANGRLPNQKMTSLASREHGILTLHFEKGETPDGMYLQPHAPQDRLATQGSVAPILAKLSDQQVEEIADRWLALRAPAKESTNEFSALWSSELPPELQALSNDDRPIAGFFTSSQDEFQFLGPEWHLHEWDDQFQGLDAMMTAFEAQGYACYLRVHPNLATKAQDCFVRERDGIRTLAEKHPDLKVIWHDDKANSYALLDISDAVVVWDSTIGLEASARGLPVWTLATSRYGETADIIEMLSAHQLETEGVEPWTVDTRAAKRFIAYLVLRDETMTVPRDAWLTWNRDTPPLASKIAGALVSGAIPFRREAIQSIVDVYRHRSVTSNLAHLRGR